MTTKPRVTLDFNWLREQSLMIATPMYGGQCRAEYVVGLLRFRDLLNKNFIKHDSEFIWNSSIVSTARNSLAHTFMKSSATHLFFWDADMSFDAQDGLDLLMLSKSYSGLIGMVGCAKQVDWLNISKVARVIARSTDRNDKALAERLPALGAKFAMLPDGSDFKMLPDRPAEVANLGTGLMLIPRYVFEQLRDSGTIASYNTGEPKPEPEKLYAYFNHDIGADQRFMSEDYYFCDRWRAIGGKIWVCGWMASHHTAVTTT
jgi:hypothetical protein